MFWKRDKRGGSEPLEDSTPTSAGIDERAPLGPAERGARTSSAREFSLLSMLELSNEISASSDLYEIADVALFNLMGQFGCARAAIWMNGGVGHEAVLLRAHGLTPQVAKAVGNVWMKWLFGRPGGEMEPVLTSDLRELTMPGLSLAEDNGLAVFVPIAVRKKRIGLLALGTRVSGATFSVRDLEMLSASLNFVGISIENTTMYNRMLESNRSLRLANEQLLELDRLKSEFFRNLNHELRTPLTVMSAYLDSLMMAETDDPKRNQLQTVKDEAQKLEGMMLNLLDFGKLMGEGLDVDLQLGDVGHPLRAWVEDRRPGVTAELRELQYSQASELPPALYDRRRLLQIVDCLVGNAVKFCPPGSKIHVRVEPETKDGTEWVRVGVGDDGPGIPEDRLPHIWDSFRQGDGSETRKHGGMGVGLAFARRLAGELRGQLDVETELGRGTTFSLRLPTTA